MPQTLRTAKGKPQSVNLHRVETVNRTGMEPSKLPTDAAAIRKSGINTAENASRANQGNLGPRLSACCVDFQPRSTYEH